MRRRPAHQFTQTSVGLAATVLGLFGWLVGGPSWAGPETHIDVTGSETLSLAAVGLYESFEKGSGIDRMRTSTQAAAGFRPLDHAERRDWSYWPRERSGVQLHEMNAQQRRMTQDLLTSVMSAQGHLKVVHIMLLEEILRQTDSFGLERDVGNYRLTFFGQPAVDGPWAFRFEGHHVSLNISVTPREIGVTPSFLGSNPGEVQTGLLAGFRVLRVEEDLGRKLARSLGADQQAGVSSAKPPSDVVTGPLGKERSEWDAWRTELEPDGLSVSEMTADQRRIVQEILHEVLGNYRPHVAAAARKKIDEDALRFLWLGSLEPGEPHYYRLQEGSFVFEYDNVQGNANHVHTVWRDRESDFGEDLLRRHYESASHP